ncbi:unnamed protein product [Pseudo-nitzschia multistriata]|uniref:HSF-type DNA-binding domain-containing protein n=1 Tax=Pseudo-nitzschia multistriata TaxID=183589 RepID=A0A448Z4G4_9STRA|nr:unnamed protein product [Pseudo-nitzschia multistriata]
MAQALDRSGLSFDTIGALSQLVEAASALTELEVNETSTNKTRSTVLVSDDDETSRVSAKVVGKTNSSSVPKKKEIFPQKLIEILADDSVSDIVSWLAHGRSFVILRPDLFCEQVLPRYLPPADSRGSTKYPSFTRKLNRWGFRQATRGADTGAFHHPFFRRDQPELCAKMVCQKSRDRQQGHQKRRLPPKKRSIPESSPPSFGACSKAMCSISSGSEKTRDLRSTHRPAQGAVPVSADDRSIGTSSTSSQASFSNTVAMTTNNNFVGSMQNTSGRIVSAGNTVPLSTMTPNITTMSLRRPGSSGIMPFISNDTKFVATTLQQRESLEVFRAAKAMLYDAYMKALNEEVS